MDKRIAKIMGWTWNDKTAYSPTGSSNDMQRKDPFWWLPYYSTDIAAAWQVVKYMKAKGWSFRFSNNAYADGQNAAAFFQGYRGIGRDILTGDYVYEDKAWAVGDECSAICRAALKALEQSSC